MPTGKLLHLVVAIVAVNALFEVICIQKGGYLRKNILSWGHPLIYKEVN
jgi:hypothetical protein